MKAGGRASVADATEIRNASAGSRRPGLDPGGEGKGPAARCCASPGVLCRQGGRGPSSRRWDGGARAGWQLVLADQRGLYVFMQGRRALPAADAGE